MIKGQRKVREADFNVYIPSVLFSLSASLMNINSIHVMMCVHV